MVAASRSSIPVINAGDGGHQHPTQTLTDLLTIRSLKGRLTDLTIGLCGDLKFGRTVHSLIHALVRYDNIHFLFISPEELRIPSYMTEMLREKGIDYQEVIRLEDCIGSLDLLYMTRVLPRVNEISVEVDDDPRAVYFRQAQYGVYVRMALICTLLGLHI